MYPCFGPLNMFYFDKFISRYLTKGKRKKKKKLFKIYECIYSEGDGDSFERRVIDVDRTTLSTSRTFQMFEKQIFHRLLKMTGSFSRSKDPSWLGPRYKKVERFGFVCYLSFDFLLFGFLLTWICTFRHSMFKYCVCRVEKVVAVVSQLDVFYLSD